MKVMLRLPLFLTLLEGCEITDLKKTFITGWKETNTLYPMTIHQPALSSPSHDPPISLMSILSLSQGGGRLHGWRHISTGVGARRLVMRAHSGLRHWRAEARGAGVWWPGAEAHGLIRDQSHGGAGHKFSTSNC